MRPSIMSLGATASAPADAWEIAIFARSSIVRSLSTVPSRTTPQWPCEVYSHMQTSVITTRSGWASFSARTAIWITPSSSYAPVPNSSLEAGIPKRITARTPTEISSVASATASAIERRSTPGIASMGSRTASPAVTNIGWTRCSGLRLVSRTRSRRGLVLRRRRRRVAGKLIPSDDTEAGPPRLHHANLRRATRAIAKYASVSSARWARLTGRSPTSERPAERASSAGRNGNAPVTTRITS